MIPNLLYLLSGLLLSWGLFDFFFKRSSSQVKSDRLRGMFGFEEVSKDALAVGVSLKLRHYLLVIALGVAAGSIIGYYTKNILFVGIGFAVGFIIPRMIIGSIKYNRRKGVLINLPGNLRLLVSKLRDCKSIQKSLEMALPIMSGATKPIFERLYQSLLLDVPLEQALARMKKEVRFRKFDDLCEKIMMGHKDGFHTRSVEVIRKNIEEITSDAQLLVEVDIKNRQERLKPYLTYFLCFAIVMMCGYMESQLIDMLSAQLSVSTIIGKIFISTMILTACLGFWKKEKFLRLNLDEL
ncbi:type II secretion system F family protein [Paenibacillus solani]|uniref:type II secretion system F family protein n=1 Tax=Paenibacillus solani TaxID=1705565 RepID=UPI003D2AFDCF